MNSSGDTVDDVGFNAIIGVIVSICGNALISVALNVQKRAHNKLQERKMVNYFANMDDPPQWITSRQHDFFPDDGYSSPRTSVDSLLQHSETMERQKYLMTIAQEQSDASDTDYLKSKLWWLGISLMVLGEVGNFVAYGFAPASTIAPLGTTTLVVNVFLAPLMLKETFRKRDLMGVLLAVMGAAIVVISSNSEDKALSPELIVESMKQMRAIVYFILTGIFTVILTGASPLYGASSIMIDLGLVAIYGGYTVLATKSVASLFSLTLFRMFTYPVTYVLVTVLIVTAVLQIKYLNKALQRFDSTEVIPTQFVLFTVSAIIGSAILYHDFDDASAEQLTGFISGCTIEFLGVYLITSKRVKNGHTPPLSISADAEACLVFPDEDGRDQVNLIPTEPRPVATDQPKRGSLLIHPNRGTPPIDWLESNMSSNGVRLSNKQHHRHSSVFRGISMASQLMDRHDEAPIQLPSSPRQSLNIFGPTSTSHRRSDSTLGQILSGITSAISAQPHLPAPSPEEEDAVEIEMPTPFSFTQQENSGADRELMPIHHPNTKLVDIEENEEYRQ
ncbi:magnesium transporter NIPA-domain-containing protein [Pilobolus umbonatus]|nr:magnesium transporter NIPA-domain-containing protein [Pilobolus umbonatus]